MVEAAALTGGCQCGACRFEIAPPLPPLYVCHCRECRKQSGSAFGMSMPVALADVVLKGEFGCYTRETESGSRTDCYFCRSCGTRLYHRSHRKPDVITIKAGTLDCADDLVPAAHLWVSRKQSWVEPGDQVPTYEKQPADLAAWRQELSERSKGNRSAAE